MNEYGEMDDPLDNPRYESEYYERFRVDWDAEDKKQRWAE